MERTFIKCDELSLTRNTFRKTEALYIKIQEAFKELEQSFKEEANLLIEDGDLTRNELIQLSCALDDDIREFFNYTLFGRE